MTKHTVTINGLKKPTRLDRVLRQHLPRVGRKAINQLLQDRQVTVNNKTVWLNSWKVHNGDTITLHQLPQALPETPSEFDMAWLLHEDEHLVVVNKPAGLLSQGTKYTQQANLLSMVQAQFGDVTLFHRLDRDTSGVILLTRTKAINRYLDIAFKAHTVKKRYEALVAYPNKLQAEGLIDARLAPQNSKRNRMKVVTQGGKSAMTHYEAQSPHDNYQAVSLYPQTGRTHQLRVHLAHYDAPILGDRIYSTTADAYSRLYLHAHQITLPASDDFSERTFTALLPDDFAQIEI
ncbi:MAG: RluA family pseudouridine synthase [Chloroflexota bacterium]